MAEYIANAAQLGWLIDPFEARVYIYRHGNLVSVNTNRTCAGIGDEQRGWVIEGILVVLPTARTG